MLPHVTRDLWEYLSETEKTVVLYGMGNGADKILAVLFQRNIPVGGVFASDGFARGNLFHGMPVRTWSDIKETYGKENVIVLLSFGTSRPEVMENILRIRAETELYAPDVPAFGDTLFTRAFYEEHIEDFSAARTKATPSAMVPAAVHSLRTWMPFSRKRMAYCACSLK